jgi:hypothetical protein
MGNNVAPNPWTGGMNNPESISPSPNGAFPFLVGDAGGNVIRQFNSSGALVNSWVAAIQDRGTDWVDLQPDLKTVYYTSEGTSARTRTRCARC